MDTHERMAITRFPTGVAGLDEVLGGGMPEYSFNLVAGSPGSGKTTLVHQILFANATAQKPALYFTLLGEPPMKMLRYQQQLGFFDEAKVGDALRFIDLGHELMSGSLDAVLDRIIREVNEANPRLICVDSFRSVLNGQPEGSVQVFLQKLALHLTSWQVTSFLIAEFSEMEPEIQPIFTIADGIIRLSQDRERNAVVRKLDVVKMRGQAPVPGMHTFRISSAGVQVFPRNVARVAQPRVRPEGRAATGVPGLDELLSGGLPIGDATLIAGPSGTGKTMFSTHFMWEGLRQGERGVLAVFEEHPSDYTDRARSLGFDLDKMVEAGTLRVLSLRPVDLSADELLLQIQQVADEIGASRVVVDSINGLELALATNHREDFREALYRLNGGLTGHGVSIVYTVEVFESFNEIKFSPHAISFLAQNVVFLRYAEFEGELRKVMAIVKMRRSGHSLAMHEYELTGQGMRILRPLREYRGILTGIPEERPPHERDLPPGLTPFEGMLLHRLRELGQGTAGALSQELGGADTVQLRAGLERLLALSHVLRSGQGDEAVYRPVSRPLGRT